MKVSWKFIDNRGTLPSVFFFVVGGLCIHRAMQFADAAQNVRTTTAYDVYIQRENNGDEDYIFKRYSCSYNYNVAGVFYSGHEGCQQFGADDSIKAKLSNSVRGLTLPNATVYYNPANPSMNSLLEFGAKSKDEYQKALLWIGIGIIINVCVVVGVMLEATNNKGNSRQFVDARGTVIDPDEIGFGTGFGGPSRESWKAEQSSTSATREAAKVADFATSWGLRELYLEVVKQVHPDHASNEADRALRERLTKEANTAYKRGDDETLRRVLEEYKSVISATC